MSIEKKYMDGATVTESINSLVQNIIDFIGNLFHQEVALDEFVGRFSDKTDKIILDELEKGNRYGGGKFHIQWQDDANFQYLFEMYFRTPDGKYVKMEGDRKGIPLRYLLEADRRELKKQGAITYEIDEPAQNNQKSQISVDDVKSSTPTEKQRREAYSNATINDKVPIDKTEHKESVSLDQAEITLENLLNNMKGK